MASTKLLNTLVERTQAISNWLTSGSPANVHLATTAWEEWTGTAGVNDDDVIYTSGDVSGYNVHYIEATAGTIDIDVSLDGTNWVLGVAGIDLTTTSPATRVTEEASGTCVEVKGKFKKIRVNQKGLTASNARGAHGVV